MNSRWIGWFACSTMVVVSMGACSGVTTRSDAAASANDVVTFKNDNARSGLYDTESILTPQNVASGTFGLKRILGVDGKVDAQPLYVSALTIAGRSHNVVFVATEHDTVYAFDADSGTTLWQVSLLGTGETPSDPRHCFQILPEIGVTSTPVIDRRAGPHGTLYVEAMSMDKSPSYHQRLHALDLTTGAELSGGPTEITATFPNHAGTTRFDPGQYEERAALVHANGTIYTTWASHCDGAPYSGWIMAFDQKTLQHTATLNIAPNSADKGFAAQGPAIWMSGAGPSADAAGNLYLLAGNGRFETTLDARGFPDLGDYGNAFLKITGAPGNLAVADYFTMWNEAEESRSDRDLGSGGPMLLPDLTDSTHKVRHLAIGAGKDSNLYVVDRDAMGKFDPTGNHIWQELDKVLPGGVFSSPAYFNGKVYYGDVGGTLKAFDVSDARLSSAPSAQSNNRFNYPGTSPVVSANGTLNGIVWAHENKDRAVLHAYEAANLRHELYNSDQAGERDHFGKGNKFITPTVAGGQVFVGTTNGVAVFGLLH